MRGKSKLIMCVLAGALALPAGAAAETAEDRSAPDKRSHERLTLDCRAFRHDGRDLAGCHWSASKSRDFAGYRLMRASRDERPAAVFTTRDRDQRKFLDRDVATATHYLYVVQALDAAGEVIGQSNAARVHTGDRPHERPGPRPALIPAI